MAHPERQEWAKELSQKLQAPIVYDRISNVWDTCRRAWLSQVSVGSEFTLVLQDDAIVCDNFIEKAEAILSSQSEDFVFSFYAGQLLGSRIDQAIKHGQDFVTSGMIYNEIALCMRTEHIESMVAYCDERKAVTDQEICNWCRVNRKKIYYPIPSLVDHRDSESIYRRVYKKPVKNKVRKAYKYEQ